LIGRQCFDIDAPGSAQHGLAQPVAIVVPDMESSLRRLPGRHWNSPGHHLEHQGLRTGFFGDLVFPAQSSGIEHVGIGQQTRRHRAIRQENECDPVLVHVLLLPRHRVVEHSIVLFPAHQIRRSLLIAGWLTAAVSAS
jgi:hypothetical protein